MLASPYHQITTSHSVRGVVMWFLMCFMVYWVMDGLATRPMAIEVEEYRRSGMSDEHVLSMALQKAAESMDNYWWIHDRKPYLVFDATRDYAISQGMYAAFDIEITYDASKKPIAVLEPVRRVAGMRP